MGPCMRSYGEPDGLEGPREFHLITQNLAAKPVVVSALIAVAGANGCADVL